MRRYGPSVAMAVVGRQGFAAVRVKVELTLKEKSSARPASSSTPPAIHASASGTGGAGQERLEADADARPARKIRAGGGTPTTPELGIAIGNHLMRLNGYTTFMQKLTEGLWRWTARHPEWHSRGVRRGGGELRRPGRHRHAPARPAAAPGGGARPRAGARDDRGNARGRLAILITIPYHVRSSEELWRRYGRTPRPPSTAIPPQRSASRTAAFREIEPGTPLPGGVTAHQIGKPRRYEMPLHLPSHERARVRRRRGRNGRAACGLDGRESRRKVERFYRSASTPRSSRCSSSTSTGCS